ncbi:hypothetical protein [Companilactobacillus sp. HBUAS59699]
MKHCWAATLPDDSPTNGFFRDGQPNHEKQNKRMPNNGLRLFWL